MNPQELDNAFEMLRARGQAGFNARQVSDEDLDGLIKAAALIGQTRNEGFTDDQVIRGLVQKVNNEGSRRNPTQMEAIIEEGLRAQGLAPDEAEAKSLAEIVRDDAEFGFGDEKLARLAQEQGPDANNDPLREQIRGARNSREGKKRDAKLKKLNERLQGRQDRQIIFDGGAGRVQEPRRVDYEDNELLVEFAKDPFNPALEEAVANRAAGISDGRVLGMRGQLDGRQGIGDIGPRQRYQGDFRPDGAPLVDGLNKERGMFVLVPDEQGGRKRMWRERGRLYESPDAPENLERRLPDMADEIYRPVVINDPNVNANERGALAAADDRAAGAAEVLRFKRFEQGNLTPQEMESRARLGAGNLLPEGGLMSSVAVGDYAGKDVPGFDYPKRPEGYYRQPGRGDDAVEFDIRPRRAITRHATGAELDPVEVQQSILGQLKARKERGAQGAVFRARQEQNRANREEAISALLANAQPGPVGEAPDAVMKPGKQQIGLGQFDFNGNPIGVVEGANVRLGRDAQIRNLGSVKDKSADMGLQIGNQRVSLGDAYRVVNDDGSAEWVDRGGVDIPTAPERAAQSLSASEGLNAPTGAENVLDWVNKNQFEDRGAQFFGDEGILGQMNDKGAGGGIEQVDIGGAIGNFEKQVAARLGIEPKRIGSIKGMQAAVSAVLADQVSRGNALFRLEGNIKAPAADVPGVAEAMAALKIPPREQKQIANALKQRELAVNSQAPTRRDEYGRQRMDEIFGVTDPKRGGDTLQIARDVQFQQKLIAQGADGEAAKPFIGLQAGEARRIKDDRQVFGGKRPEEVRGYMEDRNRANREKKVVAAAKKGKKLGPVGMREERQQVGQIRGMQEGNVFAQIRADRDAARYAARPQQDYQGNFAAKTDQPNLDGFFGSGQQGRAFPPHPKAKLQQRPVRPQENRSVVDAGDGFRNVQVPEGFTPRAPQAAASSTREEISRRLKGEITSNALRKQRNLRIGAGGAASAAVLGSILGIGRSDEEDRREQY